MRFRVAGPEDAPAVATLHADSWRRHYRGAYSDAFLDGDVLADRLAVWAAKLRDGDPRRCTIVAHERDAMVAFANTIFDEHPTWGSLLGNLHVAHRHQRRGVGARLLALTAAQLVERAQRGALHVWVLEQNVDAQGFYEACGAANVGREPVDAPGGVPGRLTGAPMKLRCAWAQPQVERLAARQA